MLADPDALFGPPRERWEYREGELVVIPGDATVHAPASKRPGERAVPRTDGAACPPERRRGRRHAERAIRPFVLDRSLAPA